MTSNAPASARTLVEVLAACRGMDRHITYLPGEGQRRRVSFGDLHASALGVLHHLQDFGVSPGDEVILFTSSNEQFLDGFWACLLGGMVPVPVAAGMSDDHRHKLRRIFARLRRPVIYTEQAQLGRLEDFGTAAGLEAEIAAMTARSLPVEQITDISTPGEPRAVTADDTAFIQFSSGSTSEPKGVVLSHGNILTNIRAIIAAARFTDQDVSLSWMPLTHDMGLIGFHLTMLAAGISHTLMDTRLFSRRPLLWLQEASTSGATLLSSPNFGYKHFLKLYESRGCEGLDLSRVRLIFNGAEPIAVPLCERFLAALAPRGLARQAMYPVYGLAEASLAVTFPEPGTACRAVRVDRHSLLVGRIPVAAAPDDPRGLDLMVLGRPIPDCEVRITDDSDQILPAGAVGHVQIRGGNVTRGYLGQDGDQPFTGDGWLRTGDLGFWSEGELVITGRHKEIIFANGQNYYPADLESILEEHGGLELGKAVAAGSGPGPDEGDELLIFVLDRGPLEDFLPSITRVRRCLAEQAGLHVAHVIPVRQIPKTTSGKVQRGRLAAAYAAGEYREVIAAMADMLQHQHDHAGDKGTSIELTLLAICAEIIPERRIGREDDFFDLGVSSLALARLYERIDEEFPGRLEVEDLFSRPSVAALAAHLAGEPRG